MGPLPIKLSVEREMEKSARAVGQSKTTWSTHLSASIKTLISLEREKVNDLVK
jgi:hypothetical protein